MYIDLKDEIVKSYTSVKWLLLVVQNNISNPELLYYFQSTLYSCPSFK